MEPESPFTIWIAVVAGYLLPLAYITCAKIPGAHKGSSCPFSPRAGWVLIVLFTGFFGWLLFINSRRKKRTRNKT